MMTVTPQLQVTNLSLFAPEPPPLAAQLQPRLAELARQQIYLGTSSWKYEGWLGSVYSPERYLTRGKVSKKKFDDECLAEYAETFPVVCGDFTFYQFPSQAYWQRLFTSTPPSLRFAFKVPEEITVETWPRHERYGARGGSPNETFLSAHVFTQLFAQALQPYRGRVATLIFEFGAFAKLHREEFQERLRTFLAALPPDFRYAVEVRNPEFLGSDYFGLLGEQRVAHVFNSWTRMPDLSTQIRLPGAYSTDFTVVRALLKPGRPYEQAVEKFSPYERVQEPYPEGRAALREIIQHARREQRPSYIFVNNRFEGNAPGTMLAVTEPA